MASQYERTPMESATRQAIDRLNSEKLFRAAGCASAGAGGLPPTRCRCRGGEHGEAGGLRGGDAEQGQHGLSCVVDRGLVDAC
jgi:hypothetical protein